jgi:hypothetical protein
MSDSEKQVGQAERAEFEKHCSRFFALIGHCVTRFQSIEDYLPDVLAAARDGAMAAARRWAI